MARDDLLAGARRVLLRDGITGFTLEAVANECDVTKQGLLYHFASKDELVFEIFLGEWIGSADGVATAVDATDNGPDALAAMIRSVFSRYRDSLDLFRLVTQDVQRYDPRAMTKERFARLRPVNDRLYGGAEKRLKGARLSPRRLAFLAHCAVMGVLAMKALTERFDDPLIHDDEDLVADLCRVFAAAAKPKER